jgi:hypothetical protein
VTLPNGAGPEEIWAAFGKHVQKLAA